MQLKSLTLSGFKSFGKTTIFEFSSPVTAIVGPNGSGKSNVVEAIRWVLGEQSMKSLRGKKGEDLIFNGSELSARLGRAEVKLVFDNSQRRFPLEFDDVVVARRVMRDGTNEYVLNGSVVRLKDIYGMLAVVGLGSTQHHIISQGEVDRILWASPRERQEMIEESLGLKEYHLKKREAERKLAETAANVRQVDLQRKELAPHLKYLALQSEKMRAHEDFKKELDEKVRRYISCEHATIIALEQMDREEEKPFLEKRKELEHEISVLTHEIHAAEKTYSGVHMNKEINEKLVDLDEKQKNLNRELGRVEGALLTEGNNEVGTVSPAEFLRELGDAILFVDGLMQKDSFESLKSGLKDIKVMLESLRKLCRGEKRAKEGDSGLREKKRVLGEQLREIEKKINDLREQQQEETTKRESILGELREQEHHIREYEHELESVREKLREVEFAKEKRHERRAELANFIRDMRIDGEQKTGNVFRDDAERHTLVRAIERLRIKLEEAGGIDGSVLKEFDETKNRDEFLERELEDLRKAVRSLEGLMKELDGTLKEKFVGGLRKINEQFQSYFKQMFGGGKASLYAVKPEKNEDGEEDNTAGGVEISVDGPRKRLRSLDMLSGGERALTSVALLFAMSAIHPPPFLVLDETDAALDEANSGRYGDLVDELSRKLQLVIITHNRQTMEHAGALFGVTMDSAGFSRILSLKFEEAKEYASTE